LNDGIWGAGDELRPEKFQASNLVLEFWNFIAPYNHLLQLDIFNNQSSLFIIHLLGVLKIWIHHKIQKK
jgi:hypothetical protein